jgi:predicted metal-dependent hydrolase
MEILEVTYKDKIIKFELHRKNVKNINLNIKPDTTIMVSANEKVPTDFVLNFVKEKAPWILKNVTQFKEYQPERKTALEFISGESVKYLGKQYRLKIIEDNEEKVKYFRGYIYIHVKDKSNYTRKENLFNNWMREKATIIFQECLDKIYPILEKYNIKKPEIMIRTMKARWGSCIKDKNIILLNFELIKAPKYCIEYVILHELIHFLHRNHDHKFYNFMTSLMPDWKQRKEILDEEVVRNL